MEIRPAKVSDAEGTVTFLREFRGEGLQTVLQHDGVPSVEDQEAFIRSHDGVTAIMLGFRIEGVRVGALKNGDVYEDIIEMAKKA